MDVRGGHAPNRVPLPLSAIRDVLDAHFVCGNHNSIQTTLGLLPLNFFRHDSFRIITSDCNVRTAYHRHS